MYLEDDKDLIIGTDGEVQINGDEDLISWDEVLNDSNEQRDDVVSIKGGDNASLEQDDSIVNLGDELELVQDEEDVNDDQLREILGAGKSGNTGGKSSRQGAFDAFGDGDSTDEIPDLDLDNPENNFSDNTENYGQDIQIEDNEPQGSKAEGEPIITRKDEIGIKKAKGGLSPVLIAILFFLVVVAGVYYYVTFFSDNEDEDIVKPSVQETMNNTTQEDIKDRNKADIDVVNEENVDEVKPDETEDKKEVLTIIPTGRANPFVPVSKYMKGPDKVIAYDKVNIPKPPKEFGQDSERIDKLLSIAVSGIMYDPQKPSAIITFEDNDYFVQKGDRLDDYKVVDITKNSVLIALGKNIYRANVGEEFKITSFAGNAQFINGGQGGRLYHSVSADKDTESTTKKGYVSPLDVEVKAKTN